MTYFRGRDAYESMLSEQQRETIFAVKRLLRVSRMGGAQMAIFAKDNPRETVCDELRAVENELPEMHPCCLALFNRIYSSFAQDTIQKASETEQPQGLDPFAFCLAWEVVETVPALPDEVREHASSTLASTVEGFANALKAAHEKDASPIELV